MTSVSKTFVIFKTFNKLLKTYFYYVRVNSFCEHPPRGQTPGIWYTMSTGDGHLTVNCVRASRAFENHKESCFVASCRHFWRRSEVKGHFGYRRAFFDHKRAILKILKPFTLSLFGRSDSFRELFYATKTVMFMTMDWGGHLTVIVGIGGGHLPVKIARSAGHLTDFFKSPGFSGRDAGGWNWLAH